jgi:queuine tRNA-ribosyltransferase
MHWRDAKASGADIVLGNSYHLMLRPGAERIAALGGLHAFTGWRHPILTDSGGFQVMSLAELRKLDDNGAVFRSHLDGATVTLTPERAIEIQALLGSDIAMQLDECIRLPQPRAELERAMCRSLAWAERCKRAFETAGKGATAETAAAPGAGAHALFGIVQGGDDRELRIASARAVTDMGFDGNAIGGLAVGEPQHAMLAIIETVAPLLPPDRPRYLMGVGTPDDILEAAGRGVDMFDCVLPTRNGRHGVVYSRFGPIHLRNARHAADPRPLDGESRCQAARDNSRAYLHHLVKASETLGAMLLSEINLYYYQDLMAGIRAAIAGGRFEEFRATTKEGWARGDIPSL